MVSFNSVLRVVLHSGLPEKSYNDGLQYLRVWLEFPHYRLHQQANKYMVGIVKQAQDSASC